MFFIMGISQGLKDLGQSSLITCPRCGSYGRYIVYMTYTYLSLFFIPVFKWGKRYFVRTSCCNATYEVDKDTAYRILDGENITFDPGRLIGTLDSAYDPGEDYGYADLERDNGESGPVQRYCPECGYTTVEDFDFCPKCGHRLESR